MHDGEARRVDGDDPLAHAAAWRDAGRGVALATVVSTWGSAPRPAGSLLVVNDAGDFLGSVSGGCVESAVVEEALGAIADGAPRRLRFGVTREMAWEVGLACGGEIEVYVERLARGLGALDRLLAAKRTRRAVARVTDLASGEAWGVEPDADAAPGLPDGVSEAALAALGRDRAELLEVEGRELFVNVFPPSLRLVVVGAVHIAQPLVGVAALAGFDPIVVDPRPAWASPLRFPGTEIVAAWPGEALEALRPDARTAVVTLAHDPKLDDPALSAALRSDAFYVGALGSRRTHAARVARLRRAGFSAQALARISGPVGLAIGARSPAEIAVSIVAEMVERLRRNA